MRCHAWTIQTQCPTVILYQPHPLGWMLSKPHYNRSLTRLLFHMFNKTALLTTIDSGFQRVIAALGLLPAVCHTSTKCLILTHISVIMKVIHCHESESLRTTYYVKNSFVAVAFLILSGSLCHKTRRPVGGSFGLVWPPRQPKIVGKRNSMSDINHITIIMLGKVDCMIVHSKKSWRESDKVEGMEG